MKPKFILLDHSVVDYSGHHYTYANSVLQAAKSLGFKTIFAVNKNAAQIKCPCADAIFKAFSRTFWENQMLKRNELILGACQKADPYFFQKEMSLQYTKELQKFFDSSRVTNGDVIFIPTLGSTELLGIQKYSSSTNAKNVHYHLLLRRDLPKKKFHFDLHQYLNVFRLRANIKNLSEGINKGSCTFYCDTDDLSLQYSKLGSFEFKTLHPPIDQSLKTKNREQKGPLIVSCLGDAREEKGFQYLPRIISDFRSMGLLKNDVKFRIQTNFPERGSTMKMLKALEELKNNHRLGVEILDGPFDTKTYHDLLAQTDIALLPYCSLSYSARSSGIFVEALASGIPTIYPAGSSMAASHTLNGSLGFKDLKDIPKILDQVCYNYSEFEAQSIAQSHFWQEKHSAKKLVHTILSSNFNPA